MAFSIFIAVLVLQATVIRAVVGQLPAGSISIDCGLDANSSGYTEAGIFYVPDGSYVDGGQNYMVPPENINKDHRRRRPLLTVRSFPSGKRNCYALPTVAGAKYLVRVQFYYGNYDGKNLSSTLQFDLYLGVNYWDTIFASNDDEDDDDDVEEALFMAWASWVPVCLVNTNHGTPYVSSVELRPLSGELYPAITPDKSLYRYERRNMGSSTDLIAGYPDDKYDRYWWPMEEANSKWANLSTKFIIQLEPKFVVPSPVLQTAITTAANNNTVLSIISWEGERPDEFMVLLHFADFQNSQFRQFDAYLNHNLLGTPNTPYSYTPPYLAASCVSSSWFRSKDGAYNITLEGTEDSILAPMLNAFEIYGNISHKNPMTFVQHFDAIMAIKLEYGIKKNWTGDPCFPSELIWTGVKCSNASDNNATRIISLDLSNSDLHGLISNNFTLLTALEHLDLSGNHLTGSIPDSFCKSYAGTFNFSYDSERDMCNRPINLSPATNRTVIIIVSVMAPMLVMAILVISYFIWRTKRKHNICTHDGPRVPEITDDRNCRKNHWDHLSKDENRQFSYEELEKFTDNFKQFIGRGGFGHVYYGCLEDNTEVAIKMRSESSSHGLHEFLAEVQSLTKVHHRNLVSLVGYCWEKDHLALVYEYMSQGNLCDHLRGKIGDAETLNWATRLRIVIDAAQGLEYLHKGCNLPIIHGDVKTNNILLGKKLNAKISDLGLSKTYHSDTQTHISATAAGSMGYIDPEYYTTGRLNESSDVYSFGVVLLEVATGEPPIIPGHGHIVQRVKQKIATGNISKVADVRLQDFYDVSSMWKVVDTAMMCTADIATQRPTMGVVVAQLKESLALEEAPGEDRDGIENLANDTALLMSPFAPLAR